MDGKKMIRNAIIAFLVVGVLGLGISIYAEALGYEGSVFESMFASKDSSNDTKESEEEITSDENSEDISSEKSTENTTVNFTDNTIEETESLETTEVDDALDYGASLEKEEDTLFEDDSDVKTDESSEESMDETVADLEETAETSNLREGPFYKYTITADFGLNIYDDPDVPTGQGNIIGVIPAGTTGYAIAQGNRRTLIDYNGKLGYVSNTYTSLTEVSAEEYPNELKSITWENASVGDKGVEE